MKTPNRRTEYSTKRRLQINALLSLKSKIEYIHSLWITNNNIRTILTITNATIVLYVITNILFLMKNTGQLKLPNIKE